MAVCVHEEVLNSNTWSDIFMIKAEVVIVTCLCFNTIIALKVLPQMRKNLGFRSITVEAIFMLVLFEVIMCYRIFIILKQDDFKSAPNDECAFKVMMITYFTCCEMVLYIFLIVEIMH